MVVRVVLWDSCTAAGETGILPYYMVVRVTLWDRRTAAIDALCVLHPSHDAPHCLFACSKQAPGDKTERPLWPLIHTSYHKKPYFLLDIVTPEILSLPSPHRLILRYTFARAS